MGFEAKMTGKGQATIQAEVRQRLGLHPGDRIAFIEVEHGFLVIPRNRPAKSLFGLLAAYAIPNTTIEDYNRAVGGGIGDHVSSVHGEQDY